jgi:ABC-type branched-subunit amino acid transport system permease subunit
MNWDLIFTASFSYAFGAVAVAYCLAAIGLNLQFGYTGLLNFGQAAFLAAAGYGLAVTVTTFDLSFWLGMVVGIIATILLAVLLGIPTLRLRADYLAIVTIAAAEVVRLVVRSVKFKETFGGSDGLQQFGERFYAFNPLPEQRFQLGPFSYSDAELWVMIVGWSLVAVVSFITYLLVRSPWGRVLKGIREDEDAVRSLGKNVYWYKMQALMLGAVTAGFGGFVLGFFFNAVSPDTYATTLTFAIYTILILGGAARVMGPILGVIIFNFIFQFIDVTLGEAVRLDYVALDSGQTAAVRLVLVGVGLMLLMIFRPQGIIGDRREIALDAR